MTIHINKHTLSPIILSLQAWKAKMSTWSVFEITFEANQTFGLDDFEFCQTESFLTRMRTCFLVYDLIFFVQ